MRENLFHGKRTDNREWIEGSLVVAGDYCCILPADENSVHPTDYPYLDSETGTIDGHLIPVDPSTVGQYTGLTDKNGKKIFEGDIVYYQCSDVIAEVKIGEYRDTESHKDAYGCYVEFVEDGQIVQDVMNHMESDETYGCEVIGNIYDNPELLEDNP